MLRRFVLAVVAIALCAIPAHALSDVRGSRDHPLFRRPAGYRIVSYSRGDRSATVPVGDETVALSGKTIDILYRTEGRPLSSFELTGRFLAALKKAGGEVAESENPLLGGGRVVGKLARPGRTVWVMQDVPSLREYRLIVVETPNNLRPLPCLPVSDDIYETEARVLDLLHRVERTGSLEFPVKFARGSSIPLKGYEANFRKVAMLMEKDPSLRFRVETWTDDGVRPMEARLQQRARETALVEELVRLGADGSRLTAAGGEGEDAAVSYGIVRLVSVDASETPKQ